LQHNSYIVESKFSSHPFEDVDGDLGNVRTFHINADKNLSARGILDYSPDILISEFGIDRQTELRELYGDV
jgi:hypothetical protein